MHAETRRLEQPVVVLRLSRNDLQHIPVLHYFSVAVKAKNINSRIVFVARPLLVTMENNVVIFRYRLSDDLRIHDPSVRIACLCDLPQAIGGTDGAERDHDQSQDRRNEDTEHQ